jgi:hypothetical protein
LFSQPGCQFFLQRIPDRIGIETYFVKLVCDFFHIPGMAMPDGNYGMASVQVKKRGAALIPDSASECFDRGYRKERINIK